MAKQKGNADQLITEIIKGIEGVKGQKISIDKFCEREGVKDGKGFWHYWK